MWHRVLLCEAVHQCRAEGCLAKQDVCREMPLRLLAVNSLIQLVAQVHPHESGHFLWLSKALLGRQPDLHEEPERRLSQHFQTSESR